MNWISMGFVLLIGLFLWGGWPLIAQGSKVTDPFVRGFLVNAVTAIGFLPFLPGRMTVGTFASAGAWLLIAAGLLNFGGHYLFPKLQTASGSQVSLYMTMIPALCVITSAIGGPVFYGDPVTLPKIFFTALIITGVIGLAFVSIR